MTSLFHIPDRRKAYSAFLLFVFMVGVVLIPVVHSVECDGKGAECDHAFAHHRPDTHGGGVLCEFKESSRHRENCQICLVKNLPFTACRPMAPPAGSIPVFTGFLPPPVGMPDFYAVLCFMARAPPPASVLPM